jgi:hypothetical protein
VRLCGFESRPRHHQIKQCQKPKLKVQMKSQIQMTKKEVLVFRNLSFGGFVKSLNNVTPAKAGVQNLLNFLDSRFCGNDKNGEIGTFYEMITYGF